MPRAVPVKPTEHLVEKYLKLFERDRRYAPADEGLTQLIAAFPKNSELSHVAVKASAINALYSAGILAIYQVAVHVHRLDIDTQLAQHSTAVVDKIAKAKFRKKRRNLFSFASKYCS
jgi:hypothetical protein